MYDIHTTLMLQDLPPKLLKFDKLGNECSSNMHGTASVLIKRLTIKIHMMFIRILVRACSLTKSRKEVREEERNT